jgi:hypothetical protein
MEERLILGCVVGAGLKVNLQRIPHLVAFGRGDDDSDPNALVILGSVKVESPPAVLHHWLRQLSFLPVDEEVRECLGLDGLMGLVLDVVDANLQCPLGKSPCRIASTDNIQ